MTAPDILIFSSMAALILLALYFITAGWRIRWERERGLYAKEAYAFYWKIHGPVQFFLKNFLGRCLLLGILGALTAAGFVRARSLLSENGWRFDAGKPDFPGAGVLEKDKLEELKTWFAGLETVRKKEGPAAYCRKIKSEMALLGERHRSTAFEQVEMRSLSQDWVKHCEQNGGKA